VKVEQLHDGVDLVTKITRSEFESECAELFAKVTAPIDDALRMANLSLKQVNSVELLGGGVRIPKIKKMLDDYFRESKVEVGQHLNGDEAMALGASFRAANLSTAFRVRRVGQSDINYYGVSVVLQTLSDDPSTGEAVWERKTEVFPPKYLLSSKLKTVTFPHDKDIVCHVQYSEVDKLPEGTDPLIAVFNITGIAKFSSKALLTNSSIPKVHLSFVLDTDGVVALVKAEATSEVHHDDVGSYDGVQSDEKNATHRNDPLPENPLNVSGNTTLEESLHPKRANSTQQKKLKKEGIIRETLVVSKAFLRTNPPQWSDSQISESQFKLTMLQKIDNDRKAREAALNELEAYIYKVKNRFVDEESELGKVSTQSQRDEVLLILKESEDWMENTNSRVTNVSEYNHHLFLIKQKAEPIFHRHSELSNRASAFTALFASLNNLKSKVSLWGIQYPQINEKETDEMLEAVNKVESWGRKVEADQAATSPFDAPVVESTEISSKLKPLVALYDKLVRKPSL